MTRSTVTILASALGLAFGCGQSNQTVKPSDMSAEAHRQEAQKANAAADRAFQKAGTPMPPPNLVTGGGSPEGYYDWSVYDVKNEQLARARELGEHARQHEAAAAALEKFEQAQCKQFPPEIRAACPLLGPVVRIVDIPTGVTVRFAQGTRVDAVLAHMRCHLAFAQAHGFDPASSCPLYMKGIDIRAGSEPGGATIDVVSADAKVARRIQALSREEALVVQGGPQ